MAAANGLAALSAAVWNGRLFHTSMAATGCCCECGAVSCCVGRPCDECVHRRCSTAAAVAGLVARTTSDEAVTIARTRTERAVRPPLSAVRAWICRPVRAAVQPSLIDSHTASRSVNDQHSLASQPCGRPTFTRTASSFIILRLSTTRYRNSVLSVCGQQQAR